MAHNLDLEVADEETAEGGGEPELLVVARARVEADHERGHANARGEGIDVGGEVDGARLLSSLNDDHNAGMGDT